MSGSSKARKVIFLVVPFVLFLFAMEMGLRAFHSLPFFANVYGRVTNFSDDLGWESSANIRWEGITKGYGEIRYSTTEHGFRIFDDSRADKFKIFVLGDSITQAYTVSDGEAYFDYLGKNLPEVEMFVYGCGGYGSLQEYLVLDEFIDVIKPDLIVWQFSANDLYNNLYELEASTPLSNHMVRPYYLNGTIKRLYPKPSEGLTGLLYAVGKHSRLFRFFDIRLDILKAKMAKGGPDPDPSLIQKAMRTTAEIMGLVKDRAEGIPIVAFSASEPSWLTPGTFLSMSEEHGFHFVPGVPEAIREAKKSGMRVDGSPYDGHWNANGHRIAGERILGYLRNANLLQ